MARPLLIPDTVVRFFHKQGYALKTPQPWPAKQDEQLCEAFLQKLEQLFNRPDVDIWFADESGFEGDPRPRKRWDKKGRKTRVTRNGGHLRMNVIGMVCPRTGEFFAIEASHSDSATYQAILDVIHGPEKPNKPPLSERYFDKRSRCDVPHFLQARRVPGADRDKSDILIDGLLKGGALSDDHIGK